MSAAITIRQLDAPDASSYRALMLEGYAAHPEAFTATVDERKDLPLSWWERRIGAVGSQHELVLGAFRQGELVGAVGLSFNPRPKMCHKAELFALFVHPRAARAGIGAQLVDALIDRAAQRPGVFVLQLTVTEGNAPAISLYRRMGFAEFGVEPFGVLSAIGYKSKLHMWRRIGPA